MADALEENVWDGEGELDLERNVKSDEEYESDTGHESDLRPNDLNDHHDMAASKKDKKRKRLEAAKEKKRQRVLNPKSTSLTTEEMCAEVTRNRPIHLRDNTNEFLPEHFCFPELDPSSTTPSARNKHVCPFVRALSAGLPSYRKLLTNVPGTPDDLGCPVLVIICSSAIRATEIIKSISTKLIKCKVSKLFAKHFKIEEQMGALSKEYCPVAVGTPNRVVKLLELGALSMRRTKMLLLDVTPDKKSFTLMTLKDVQDDLYKLLYKQVLPEIDHMKLSLIRE